MTLLVVSHWDRFGEARRRIWRVNPELGKAILLLNAELY